MAQRLAVFAIAISTAVFTAHGTGTPASAASGFSPAAPAPGLLASVPSRWRSHPSAVVFGDDAGGGRRGLGELADVDAAEDQPTRRRRRCRRGQPPARTKRSTRTPKPTQTSMVTS
jgi:hypothetical protein